MILLLLADGRTLEVFDCEDVIHKPGYLICLDYAGEPITTFATKELVGYTLNPHAARALQLANGPELDRTSPVVLEKWWSDP